MNILNSVWISRNDFVTVFVKLFLFLYMRQITYSVEANGCHHCTSHAKNTNGYPVKTRNGKQTRVSRIVYSNYYLNGDDIPNGLIVRHKCDNRACINPNHLELGTFKDNAMDMVKRGRCRLGEKNHLSKLTWKQVVAIFYSQEKLFNLAIWKHYF